METTLALPQYQVQAAGKSFGIRAVAYMIDSVVWTAVTSMASIISAFFVGIVLGIIIAMTGQEMVLDEQVNQCLYAISGLILFTLYFVLFEWLYGATPGKLILGMRVIKRDGSPCGLKAGLIRALMRFIDGLFFAIPAYTKMKPALYQRYGDDAANTVVVGAGDASILNPRPWWWFLVAAGSYLLIDLVVSGLLILASIR